MTDLPRSHVNGDLPEVVIRDRRSSVVARWIVRCLAGTSCAAAIATLGCQSAGAHRGVPRFASPLVFQSVEQCGTEGAASALARRDLSRGSPAPGIDRDANERAPGPVEEDPPVVVRTSADDGPAEDDGAEVADRTEKISQPRAELAGEAKPDDVVPLETVVGEGDDARRAICLDLRRALEIASSSNPTVALAYEGVRGAESERLLADVMILPTVRAGADLHTHSGNLLSAGGTIVNVDRQSTYRGLGASAVGSGTATIPGIRVVAHVADAWYEPQAAERRVAETRFDASAIGNAVLLDVAIRYFDVLGARAELDALLKTREEWNELSRQTANFARTGQGRQADADRAASELRLVEVQLDAAEERLDVAAAELARLLHINPACDLRFDEPLVELHIDRLDAPLDELIHQAILTRPEIGARSAAIGVACSRYRKEVVRPFVPTLSAGYSAGTFAGGNDFSDRRFSGSDGREDFDAFAIWSLDGLGFGNCALRRKRESEVCMARARRIGTVDQVRREVAEAHAGVSARLLELEASRRARISAEQGYRLDAQRSRNLEGLPIELVNSINLLSEARLEEIRALRSLNQDQLRLVAALGRSPRCLP